MAWVFGGIEGNTNLPIGIEGNPNKITDGLDVESKRKWGVKDDSRLFNSVT